MDMLKIICGPELEKDVQDVERPLLEIPIKL